VRYATKDSKESKTYSYTEEDTICLGSLSRRLQKNLRERFICVLSPHVFIMTLQEHLVTSLVLRNTSLANMVRRNGSVISAPRNMLFNLTGKLIPRLVALGNTDVTVALSSPGNIYQFNHHFPLNNIKSAIFSLLCT
jgi:hypothetical protein